MKALVKRGDVVSDVDGVLNSEGLFVASDYRCAMGVAPGDTFRLDGDEIAEVVSGPALWCFDVIWNTPSAFDEAGVRLPARDPIEDAMSELVATAGQDTLRQAAAEVGAHVDDLWISAVVFTSDRAWFDAWLKDASNVSMVTLIRGIHELAPVAEFRRDGLMNRPTYSFVEGEWT